jgi:uncharacterized membrane protein
MFGFGIIFLVFIGVVVFLLVREYSVHSHTHVPFTGQGYPPTGQGQTGTALDIAKRRFASGEINHEEFDSIVKRLKEADTTPPGTTG